MFSNKSNKANPKDTHQPQVRHEVQACAVQILPSARSRESSISESGLLSVNGAESRLLARRPPLDIVPEDIYAATDHAPIYSSPGVRFRSTLSAEDIGQPILWALNLSSFKHVLTHALLMPWDRAPSIPGMYQHLLLPISERVASLLSDVHSMEDFTPAVIAQLNDAIPHRRIEWIGTMRDLAHGESQHARETRLRYFLEIGSMQLEDSFADTPDSVPSIPVDQNERFLEFLRGVPINDAMYSPS